MTLKAEIHHRNDSSDESFDNIQKKAERQRISTPMQKPNEFKRPSIGFGLQASGPLSTKSAMANMKFQGRQFSVSTQEKVKYNSTLLGKIWFNDPRTPKLFVILFPK